MTTDAEIIEKLTDMQVFGLTLWAEARNQTLEGIVAVAIVIRNRVKALSWPDNYRDVCLQPKQFSCWNEGTDKNHVLLLGHAERLVMKIDPLEPALRECLFIAEAVRDGRFLDRTAGATHYYAPDAMVPPGRVPSWALNKPVRQIGDHLFLKA